MTTNTGPLVVERYRLTRLLERGPDVMHYRAVDETGGADVVVVMSDRRAPSGARIQRFIKLEHPSLVPLIHAEDSDASTIVVIAQLNGPSLDSARRSAPLLPGTVARVFEDLVRVVAYLHSFGVAHGHITASAIEIGQGEQPLARLTGLHHAMLGLELHVTAADDLRALGQLMWHALGDEPMPGEPGDPVDLRAVIARAAHGRYIDAGRLIEDLESLSDAMNAEPPRGNVAPVWFDEPPRSTEPFVPPSAAPAAWRSPLVLAAGAGFGAALVVGLVGVAVLLLSAQPGAGPAGSSVDQHVGVETTTTLPVVVMESVAEPTQHADDGIPMQRIEPVELQPDDNSLPVRGTGQAPVVPPAQSSGTPPTLKLSP